jgi:hypothetical protein
MSDLPDKHTQADRGRALAAPAVAEVIALADAGRRRDAEDAAVHAYHAGTHAMDLLDEYHNQRRAQESTP